MRLTDKNGLRKIAIYKVYETRKETEEKYQEKHGECEIYNKLADLEDIEEELGVDLITFFKYLNAKEIFFTNDFNKINRAIVRSIDKKGLIVFEKAFSWGECDFTLYFKDYGKTWALTKEELL